MPRARRRGRPAPLRWAGLVAVAGLGLVLVGGCLEYDAQSGARPSAGVTTTPPTAKVSARPEVAAPSAPATLAPRPGEPAQLSLPTLGVSAKVVSIRARRGSLTPPADARVLGWWSDGARPGARTGSAVITGHTVQAGGGAFDDLETLRKGAPIVVTTSRGTLRYRVTTIATFRKQALARHAARIFDQAVPGRLVLITCEDWNGKVYLSNVVVLAAPVRT